MSATRGRHGGVHCQTKPDTHATHAHEIHETRGTEAGAGAEAGRGRAVQTCILREAAAAVRFRVGCGCSKGNVPPWSTRAGKAHHTHTARQGTARRGTAPPAGAVSCRIPGPHATRSWMRQQPRRGGAFREKGFRRAGSVRTRAGRGGRQPAPKAQRGPTGGLPPNAKHTRTARDAGCRLCNGPERPHRGDPPRFSRSSRP